MTYFVAPTCVILQRSRILLGQPQCGTNFLFRCYEFATTSGGVVVKSLVVKRSIVVAGHKTSVTLGRCILEWHEGNRQRAKYYLVGLSHRDRFRAEARQSVIGHSPLRTRLLSQPARRRKGRA